MLHSPVFLNSPKYEIIILKYYCGRQIDGWAGPIDEWAVLTYGSEQIYKITYCKYCNLKLLFISLLHFLPSSSSIWLDSSSISSQSRRRGSDSLCELCGVCRLLPYAVEEVFFHLYLVRLLFVAVLVVVGYGSFV